MVLIKLGYDPKKKFKWRELSKNYSKETYKKKLVVTIHEKLWKKIKNIMRLREKGFDSLIMVDGKKRTGKSTIAKTIAYLLYPYLTIDNYVAGLEEAPDKIDKAKDESVLIFDEGSLVASSKDVMAKKNKQLAKIIDVVGQKRLTLIFCMPTFFEISRTIVVDHSIFLIHVYTDNKLVRGRFAYFGTKRKKTLYNLGKKNFGSYSKPKSNFTGRFVDFHVAFEEEYLKLKRDSLAEALGSKKNGIKVEIDPVLKQKLILETKIQIFYQVNKFLKEVTQKRLAEAFGTSERNAKTWVHNAKLLEKGGIPAGKGG